MGIKILYRNGFILPVLIYLQYLVFRYIFNRSFSKYRITGKSKLRCIDKGISFFGYYNNSPCNSRGDVLFLKVKKERVRGSLTEAASIMVKRSDREIKEIAVTRSWNWQQGCMLQWFPGSNDLLLFNDYDIKSDQFISKIVNIEGELIGMFQCPVNCVSKTGKFALSLNYTRLARLRPDYGYFNRKNSALPPDNDDGIWYLDLSTGQKNIIISLADLTKLALSPTMHGAIHKVNHIDINPSGTRFMFLHRWIGPQGRLMRLITANPDGTDLQILNGDEMTSHCCWLNDTQILSFCNHKGKVGYFIFDDLGNEKVHFLENMPLRDGHPSISPDGKWIITDTYPDRARFSNLFLYNLKDGTLQLKASFRQPCRYKKEMRIDLHPKWSFDSQSVFFESGHEGTRRLYEIIIDSNQTKDLQQYR
jgi:hypothetical protein